jgi:hypothetical protein
VSGAHRARPRTSSDQHDLAIEFAHRTNLLTRAERDAHRSATARRAAASTAALVSPIWNGVAKIGSVSPMISTARARSSPQPSRSLSFLSRIHREGAMLIVDSQIHFWQNGKMSAHHRSMMRWPRWLRSASIAR